MHGYECAQAAQECAAMCALASKGGVAGESHKGPRVHRKAQGKPGMLNTEGCSFKGREA